MAGEGLLKADACAQLIQALDLWQALQGLLRLTIPRQLRQRRDHDIPESLLKKLAEIGGAADPAALKEKMAQTATAVLKIYHTIIDEPALQIQQTKETTP